MTMDDVDYRPDPRERARRHRKLWAVAHHLSHARAHLSMASQAMMDVGAWAGPLPTDTLDSGRAMIDDFDEAVNEACDALAPSTPSSPT